MSLSSARVWHATIALLAFCALSYALPSTYHHGSSGVCVDRIFQFNNNGTQIENLAVRSNGNILFTLSAPSAQVWQVDPRIGNSSATLVASPAQLSNNSTATGITEVDHDLYAVASCDPTLQPGTCNIHTIDFTDHTKLAQVKYITTIPDAVLLNGLATLSSKDRIILASDSFRNPQAVFKIDLKTGHSTVVLQDQSMEPLANSTQPAIGINGLRRLGEYVYYTNSGATSLWRVKIHPDGTAAGPYTLFSNLSTVQPFVDDFALRTDGTTFIAGSNELTVSRAEGSVEVLAGGNESTALVGATSAQFGRGKDGKVLYVSSSGGMVEPEFVAEVRWDAQW